MNDPNHYWNKLIELGVNLLENNSLSEQKKNIIGAAKDIFKGDITVWLPEINRFDAKIVLDIAKEPISPLMKEALSKGCLLVSSKTKPSSSIPFSTISEQNYLENLTSSPFLAAIPIRYQGLNLGVLQVDREKGEEFSLFDLQLLDSFASQTALSLFAGSRISGNNRQYELLSLVQSVSAQISDILDLDDLTDRVTKLIRDTFNFYYVAIFTLDQEEKILNFRASSQLDIVQPLNGNNERLTKLPIQVTMGQGIIGHVAQTGTSIIANDVSLNKQYRTIDSLPETKAEAALPLMIENRVLGVLDVQSNHINAFSETDILVLNALADNIAKAVESAKLYGEIKVRANHLAVVAEVSNAIASILDFDGLINEVVKLVYQSLKYPFVRIFSVHSGRRKIFIRAGYSNEGLLKYSAEEFSYDLDDETLPISEVAREGKTKLLNNVQEYVHMIPKNTIQAGVNSITWVPLIFAKDILGVLELQSDHINGFKLDDQKLLETLADNIAVALRNAYLYQSELWRRRVADGIREVAGLLTANAAVDQVLKEIFVELENALPCDSAAIWLMEEKESDSLMIKLRLADVHLTQDFLSTHSDEANLTAEEVQQILSKSEIPSPWLIEALYSSEPLIRHPDDPYEPLGAILDFSPDYSAIAAPLWLRGQPFGVLVLVHSTSGRYGHEAQGMTETFANYAAVAIENTRLYETAHDQAWVSTVLLQVSEATQSVSSLDELLTTLVRLTPMLIGVNSCSVFLWDNNSDIFIPTATFGLDPLQSELFNQQRIRIGEIPSFDQLILVKTPIFVESDTPYSYFDMYDLETKGLVLFPMISHNEVLGAFLIDYDLIQTNTGSKNGSREIDWDEKFSIIQGIAHQAAVAVENMSLIKAQQDEAYVSIALLQVAQSIVSLNELDEILDSIVRITPILVGVKRSMIFIWDANDKIYTLRTSYGVTRTELPLLENEFEDNNYPLLDAVRKSNSIIYCKLTDATNSPLSWINFSNDDLNFIEHESFSDFETSTSTRELSKDEFAGKDYLSSPYGLLYGFPLAVKGVVMGVMLTQEREGPEDLPSRQIREKRLEISIGISQQTAMAIQNDLFQNEVVERERLEREFQLARSIQQTFLPESLPKHTKWDLYSLWRPARQVSGDFYDVIPLKGEKWGLVIADVADKGMPAALYMTLIRTLIRAAAKDDDNSPSVVLQRVNDLLVADSKSGMFVTLVYGVLSIESNTFVYANAGHNPPIIVRRDFTRLQKLKGTGMALGIFEGINIAQKTVRLKPGDNLVLYTDGITEAFSPTEIMFSEKRLMQVIRNSNALTAKELAQDIDLSVTSFIEDGLPTDDITMLILKRN